MTLPVYETGPDLSHWQGGAIDFGAIRRAGHAFVILKTTDGTTGIDPEFDANRAKAHANGLYVGMYHFAEAGNPVAEADHFASVAGAVGPKEWTVTDEERYDSNPPAWVSAFADRMKARLGSVPVTYLNQSTRDAWNWSPVVDRGSDLWLAKYDGVYSDKPGGSGAWPFVAMEQYTDKGVCPGVPGLCDMNVFYGPASALPGLSRSVPAPLPVPVPMMEDDSMILIRNTKGDIFLLSDSWAEPVSANADNTALQRKFGGYVQLTDDLFTRVVSRARAAGAPPAASPAVKL